MNVSLLTLGCPKNTVDSENLLKGLLSKGIGRTEDPLEADLLIVNTCGFIEDAKRESVEEILRLARLKDGRRLLVFGCLAERYREELRREIPEIDGLFGVGEEERIITYCVETAPLFRGRREPEDAAVGAASAGPAATSYIKVAEGCDRRCSFCVIPSIRGPFRSLDPEDLLREAESRVTAGSRELVLVAQDLAGFGRDLLGGYGLGRLLRDMASISGDFWIRTLYLYPGSLDDGLLDAIAGEEKVCKYMDIPFQHSEPKVLGAMRRAGSKRQYLELVGRIREAVPGVALRTTVMVGFPGEGEREFRDLLEFVEEARFDRLGVFKYSREEGTAASAMAGQVPARVKEARMEELLELQAGISLEKNHSLVGRPMRALIEEAGEGEARGRIYSQAPEIDGATTVRGGGLAVGSFADIRITAAEHYDLEGVPA
jgi:ribosomal protein S12 methylthiotransferase